MGNTNERSRDLLIQQDFDLSFGKANTRLCIENQVLSDFLIEQYISFITSTLPDLIEKAKTQHYTDITCKIGINKLVRDKCNEAGIVGIDVLNFVYKVIHSEQFAAKINELATDRRVKINMPWSYEDFNYCTRYRFRSDISTAAKRGGNMVFRIAYAYFHSHFNALHIEI